MAEVISSVARNDLEERSDERSMEGEWFLYIIECRTGELYVGIAKDVNKRVEEHNKGQACRYTKFRNPVKLIYFEFCGEYTIARKREGEVKKFSRAKKLVLGKDLSLYRKGLEVQKITP